MKKILSLCLAVILLLSLSAPAFADFTGEGGSTRDDEFWAYTVEEIKTLTTPIPFSVHVILLDKTHNFTRDDYFALDITKDVGSAPIILHPDALEQDILDAIQFNTWPNPDNQTAIDALNALANRTTDTEYKEFAQDVASAIKDDALSKILEKVYEQQQAEENAKANANKPETTPQPTPAVGNFSDVDDSAWYANVVNYMASTGILNGYPDGTFKPNQPVTEAEFAVICWRLANVTDPIEAATTPYGWDENIVDVENGKILTGYGHGNVLDHWGAGYVYGANKAHWTSVWIRGNRGIDVCNSPMLRGEAIDGIVELLDDLGMLDTEVKQGAKVWTADDIPDWYGTYNKSNGANYTDDGKVAVTYRNGPGNEGLETDDGIYHRWGSATILKAYNYGVISGVDEKGTCNPGGTLTRGELCQILYNSKLNTPRDLAERPGYQR